jgi:hypothetical protein
MEGTEGFHIGVCTLHGVDWWGCVGEGVWDRGDVGIGRESLVGLSKGMKGYMCIDIKWSPLHVSNVIFFINEVSLFSQE